MKKYNEWKLTSEQMQDPLASAGRRVFGQQNLSKLDMAMDTLEKKPQLKQKLLAAQSLLSKVLGQVESADLNLLKSKIITFLKTFQKSDPSV